MQRPLIPVLLVALALVVPGALSQGDWRSGLYDLELEPNTPQDRDPAFMQQTANQEVDDRIYFDAVYDHNFLAAPIVPWPKTPDTAVQPYALTYFHAYLGYWRDCNGDGFIGSALWGGDHYPVTAAVTDLGICGASTPYSNGLYVIEFLAIGPAFDKPQDAATNAVCSSAGLCFGPSTAFVRDDAAKVWQDWGLPTDPPTPTRLLVPLPQGSLSDTNGHFQYVDAFTFGRLSGTGGGGGCVLSDGTNEYCWAWPSKQEKADSHGDDRLEAVGNQCTGDANGDGLTDDPAGNAVTGLTTQSCSPVPNAPDPVTATARDRYNNSHTTDRGSTLVEPYDWGTDTSPGCTLRSDAGAGTLDPSGSLFPTYEHVYLSVVEGCSRTAAEPTGIYSNLEGTDAPADANARKVQADTLFGGASEFGGFQTDSWFNPADVGGPDQELCISDVSTVNEGTPHTCRGYWLSASQWLRGHGITTLAPNPFNGDQATFYADVNFEDVFGNGERYVVPAGLDDGPSALPAGVNDAHTYGSEQCSLGPASTWDCDPAAWIEAAEISGPNTEEIIHHLPKVGDGYDLRDVECFDNDIAGVDVFGPEGLAPGLFVLAPARDCETLA